MQRPQLVAKQALLLQLLARTPPRVGVVALARSSRASFCSTDTSDADEAEDHEVGLGFCFRVTWSFLFRLRSVQ